MTAAVAASRDLVLVTHDVADGAAFDGLGLEDWFP
jgi:predicted nucleic acid-binding protein